MSQPVEDDNDGSVARFIGKAPGNGEWSQIQVLDAFERYFDRDGDAYGDPDCKQRIGVVTGVEYLNGGDFHISVRFDDEIGEAFVRKLSEENLRLAVGYRYDGAEITGVIVEAHPHERAQ